jgi:hypothetical protein
MNNWEQLHGDHAFSVRTLQSKQQGRMNQHLIDMYYYAGRDPSIYNGVYELSHCHSCDEYIPHGGCGNCPGCEAPICAKCCLWLCSVCNDYICKNCFDVSPGCKACNNDGPVGDRNVRLTVCKDCIVDHLKTCPKQSCSERIVSSERYAIEKFEVEIRQVMSRITLNKSRLE